MKILMLVNWKIEYCDIKPADKQPPDYFVKGDSYWFYRYFENIPEVDVVDVSSFPWLEKFEKYKMRFYVWQTLRVLPRLNKYDLIVSHGMQSGVLLSLWRRVFKTKAKHIVFDIGSFNSASEKGVALKIMQFTSKSLDAIIYHTSWQKEYYNRFFPWLIDKAFFITYGVDFEYFGKEVEKDIKEEKYILCAGKILSDWETIVKAHENLHTSVKLRLVGGYDEKYTGVEGVEQLPYLPLNELIEQIRGAVFCVLPLECVKFSFGQMRFLQQMALGKCVVASKILSLVDYAIDNETALFYNPHDVEHCTKIMKKVLQDSALRKRIGENAREATREIHNEYNMAKKLERVFGQICNKSDIVDNRKGREGSTE